MGLVVESFAVDSMRLAKIAQTMCRIDSADRFDYTDLMKLEMNFLGLGRSRRLLDSATTGQIQNLTSFDDLRRLTDWPD